MTTDLEELTQGSVTSQDGTRIGYWKIGHGPAIVLLHGSMESARSHTLLARALAGDFTVYLPDRRGRGLSGPHRPDHSVRTEVEDLDAVLRAAGATLAFGVSASGAIVLEAARTRPGLQKIAVYEPALVADGAPHAAWLARFDREVAQGNLAAAMITSMYGLELAPAIFKVMPRRLLAAVTEKAMQKEDRKAGPDDITLRKLAPTVHHEGALIVELAGRIEEFREVRIDVLLLGGSKGLPFLEPSRAGLAQVLPRNRRIEFDGLDHGSSSDPSPINSTGSAASVTKIATEIRSFFGAPQ
ncbi:alpha/beta fold hydrolase [Kribbella voronezhensis]|uniref:alpha/beta fold hydrolase n=1 Tax=Kribbella voronezhensis TaxID=2512212 RepID=UPI00106282C0|nr:alpha/beta hydrolase [Kribbella voronezhensis]